jgi:hypothetical protein
MLSDPERYQYSAMPNRPEWKLPGDARVALWVAPNVEFYEFMPPANPDRNPWR